MTRAATKAAQTTKATKAVKAAGKGDTVTDTDVQDTKAVTPKAATKAATKAEATKAASTEAVRIAEAKAETDAKEAEVKAQIDALVETVRSQWTIVGDKQADVLFAQVHLARAVGRLGTHPSMMATRGPKAGKMAATKIAEAVGYSASGIKPYVAAAQDLDAIGRLHLEADESGLTPVSEQDKDIMAEHMLSDSVRKANDRKKAALEAKKAQLALESASDAGDADTDDSEPETPAQSTPREPGKSSLSDIHGALEAARAAIASFTSESGFTDAQAEKITDTLSELSALVTGHTA